MGDVDFYLRRDRLVLPLDLDDLEGYVYEAFTEYEFKAGSTIREDMKSVEK